MAASHRLRFLVDYEMKKTSKPEGVGLSCSYDCMILHVCSSSILLVLDSNSSEPYAVQGAEAWLEENLVICQLPSPEISGPRTPSLTVKCAPTLSLRQVPKNVKPNYTKKTEPSHGHRCKKEGKMKRNKHKKTAEFRIVLPPGSS